MTIMGNQCPTLQKETPRPWQIGRGAELATGSWQEPQGGRHLVSGDASSRCVLFIEVLVQLLNRMHRGLLDHALGNLADGRKGNARLSGHQALLDVSGLEPLHYKIVNSDG